MADNPYLDGRLNVGGTAQVAAIHQRPTTEKPKKVTGNDLRTGGGK